MATTARVMDADEATTLDGTASAALIEASREAEPTGIVLAYLEGSVWQYVPDSMESFYRTQRGETVRRVYVDDAAARALGIDATVDLRTVVFGNAVDDPERTLGDLGVVEFSAKRSGEKKTWRAVVSGEKYQGVAEGSLGMALGDVLYLAGLDLARRQRGGE